MTIFTSEENKPTEFTLRLIRQMAYTYRVARIDGRAIPFTLKNKPVTVIFHHQNVCINIPLTPFR